MNRTENKSGFHIEFYSILRDIVRNLWVILLTALIGYMSVDMWNGSMYTPMYRSSATLLVNLKNSATYSYTNLSSSSEMAEIFTNVFVQPTMKAYAANHLGMDGFVGNITSSVLEDTNIFTVSVTTSSPEMSYKELCAVLEIYPQISESVFSDSVIEVMRHPNMPASPVNSISVKNRTLAVIGCGMLTLALIIWFSLTRDTVKDTKVFKDSVDAKLFGTVRHEQAHVNIRGLLTRKKNARLITNAYSSFRFTEDYHRLASKFEYLQRKESAKLFLITSFAENEGKSTIAANVALALASRNHKVALIDMDFKKPALYKIFGMQEEKTDDLSSLLSGKTSFADYSFYPYKQTGVDLALNKKSNSHYVDWLYSNHMAEIVGDLRNSDYEFIIIDTPPLSVAADVSGILQYTDRSLLVVRTDCVYTAAVNDTVMFLSERGNFSGCILNDVHDEFTMFGQFGSDEAGRTSRYGRYGHYYGRYGRYGGYNSYSRYAKYSDSTEDISADADDNIAGE